MISRSRSSTPSRVHDRRIAFCDISSPLTATPPAFAAFPGPYSTPAVTNWSTPSGTVGMLAPSLTTNTPLEMRFAASLPLISFWVALGNAHSAGTSHSGLRSSEGSAGVKVAPRETFRVGHDAAALRVLQIHHPRELVLVDAVGVVDEAT